MPEILELFYNQCLEELSDASCSVRSGVDQIFYEAFNDARKDPHKVQEDYLKVKTISEEDFSQTKVTERIGTLKTVLLHVIRKFKTSLMNADCKRMVKLRMSYKEED